MVLCYYVTTVFVWVHHTPTFDAFILQYNNSETPSTVIDYWSRCCDDSKKKKEQCPSFWRIRHFFLMRTHCIFYFARLKYYMKIMENLKSLLRAIFLTHAKYHNLYSISSYIYKIKKYYWIKRNNYKTKIGANSLRMKSLQKGIDLCMANYISYLRLLKTKIYNNIW